MNSNRCDLVGIDGTNRKTGLAGGHTHRGFSNSNEMFVLAGMPVINVPKLMYYDRLF